MTALLAAAYTSPRAWTLGLLLAADGTLVALLLGRLDRRGDP